MKVISWNMMVSKNWNLSSESLIQKEIARQRLSWDHIIKKQKPTIALLQEVMFESLPSESLNNYILWSESHSSIENSKNDRSRWGSAIYVSPEFNIENITEELLHDHEIKTNGKNIAGKVNYNNEEIHICSIHIDTATSDDIRKGLNQLNKIFDNKILNMDNLIIGGDLNCDRNYIYNSKINFSKEFFEPKFGYNEFEIFNGQKLVECVPCYKQTYFGYHPHSKYPLQDDHIFLSEKLHQKTKEQYGHKNYKAFNYSYCSTQVFSDHSILVIEIDI